MLTLSTSCFVLLLFVSHSNSTKLTNVVEIDSGPIQGAILENALSKKLYSSFKGIPYARPPIDDLRFKAPREPIPWTSVLNATEHGSICAQNKGTCIGSEDCLYLNVYTKMDFDVSSELPVLLLFHGGAFLRGSGNVEKYGPDFLIDQDILLVTCNYRLGVFGFLNINDSRVSGNNGLKDQNMVLKWIKRNIAKFGGDPENVTIMGQSAGGVSVDAHLMSSESRGYFHKSIALSGSIFCPWGFQTQLQAEKAALDLGRRMTFGRDLNSVELIDLLERESTCNIVFLSLLNFGDLASFKLSFVPSIEYPSSTSKPFIDECFVNKFIRGDIHTGPHIMGFTSLESGKSISMANNFLQKNLDPWNLFGSFWQPADNKLYNNGLVTKILETTSDNLFTAGIDLKQRYMANHGQSIYYYYFTFDSSDYNDHREKPFLGVQHEEDLQYIFYKRDTDQPLDYFDSDDELVKANEIALTRHRVVTMIGNYVKHGTPTVNASGNVTWERSNSTGGYMNIGENWVMHPEERPLRSEVEDIEKRYVNTYESNECVPKSMDSDPGMFLKLINS